MSYDKLPEKYREGIRNWIEHGLEPGGFLCAVLKNDFGQAVSRADETTTFEMFLELRRFLYLHAPPSSFGSDEMFMGWPSLRIGREAHGKVWDVNAGCWSSVLSVVT